MVYIDNTQTKKEIEDAIRGNSVTNLVPTTVVNSIQPVINVNPKDYRRINIIARVTAGGTIYTTPADKDFYLTDTQMSMSINVASTAGSQTITVTPFGQAAIVINADSVRTGITSDALNVVSNQNFQFPIRLARGTNIVYAQTNAGTSSACIFGYTVEP